MARKAKSVATARKARAPAATAEPRGTRSTQAPSSGNPNRLLREAAWSAMFGRVESKNPFTR
jgi:hypothetical protein